MNTHRGEGQQEAWNDRQRAVFEDAVKDLPDATARRLRFARREALSRGSGAKGSGLLRWGLPMGATAALLLGIGWWRGQAGDLAPQAAAPIARTTQAIVPAPLVAGADDAELYAWLADTPVASESDRGDAL